MIKIKHSTFYDSERTIIDFLTAKYPVGEIGIRLKDLPDVERSVLENGNFHIEVIFESIEDLFTIALIKDALERIVNCSKFTEYNLYIPYFPFGRQDRVTEFGEAFSLKVATDYINSLGFDRVIIADPHSYVTSGLINNCIIDRDTVNRDLHMFIVDRNISFLISPDLGANKKTHEIGDAYGMPVIECAKNRDSVSGKLSGFRIINPEVIPNLPVGDGLIVDDICDGGGTFLGIAEKFGEATDHEIDLHLYVTFGCFTRGIDLLKSVFKTVGYTYDMRKESY